MIFIANFTPMCRENYRIGVPRMGYYTEIFNSDNLSYWGSNCGNETEIETAPIPRHGRTHSVSLTLPPLGVTVLRQ
ncbi:MAG TPA: alpha amylase C-terminal domain-containing protein [Flavipsychrobacter sp.]|nr:alpha amylase C-terminal domain-containing protein [Flavipsychrobacter sp.]